MCLNSTQDRRNTAGLQTVCRRWTQTLLPHHQGAPQVPPLLIQSQRGSVSPPRIKPATFHFLQRDVKTTTNSSGQLRSPSKEAGNCSQTTGVAPCWTRKTTSLVQYKISTSGGGSCVFGTLLQHHHSHLHPANSRSVLSSPPIPPNTVHPHHSLHICTCIFRANSSSNKVFLVFFDFVHVLSLCM